MARRKRHCCPIRFPFLCIPLTSHTEISVVVVGRNWQRFSFDVWVCGWALRASLCDRDNIQRSNLEFWVLFCFGFFTTYFVLLGKVKVLVSFYKLLIMRNDFIALFLLEMLPFR